jgi:hypothetical protein
VAGECNGGIQIKRRKKKLKENRKGERRKRRRAKVSRRKKGRGWIGSISRKKKRR